MLTGHASHQIGLDADIWFTPMPERRLSKTEREDISATSMLTATELAVDPKVFGAKHVALLKRAASYSDVERVLVHPAIKKAVCEATATDPDRGWLAKVRPIWGHYYHFHIRIGCPAGSTGCAAQPAPPGDDGCGKELADWYTLLTRPPGPPEKPKPPLTLEQLPAECRVVLQAGR
jgi:penicillin-insensitive murein DD-endopeptidase